MNFYSAAKAEPETFARISGRSDIHALDRSGIFTIRDEVACHTTIEHA